MWEGCQLSRRLNNLYEELLRQSSPASELELELELRRYLWPSRGIVCPSRPQTIFFSSKSKLASRWQNALAVAGLRLHRGRLLKNVGGSRKNAAGAGLKATVLQWIATAWRVLESLWKRSLCTSTSSHLLGSAKRQTQPSLSSHCCEPGPPVCAATKTENTKTQSLIQRVLKGVLFAPYTINLPKSANIAKGTTDPRVKFCSPK